jgi:hypothetical protein
MSIDAHGARHAPSGTPEGGRFATGSKAEATGVVLDAPARTAAEVLVDATRTGMSENGWTFDQAADAAVAAMILSDPEAMRTMAAQLPAVSHEPAPVFLTGVPEEWLFDSRDELVENAFAAGIAWQKQHAGAAQGTVRPQSTTPQAAARIDIADRLSSLLGALNASDVHGVSELTHGSGPAWSGVRGALSAVLTTLTGDDPVRGERVRELILDNGEDTTCNLALEAAEHAQEDEDDKCSKCSKCGGATDDNEGYDGLCGSCADSAESAGAWS